MNRPVEPTELAKGCAEKMWAGDKASQRLGIVIEDVSPGCARLSLTIGESMVNGHEMAHGGYIFMLADSAFAYACNSRNDFAVAQNCNITFLLAGQKGDRLTAHAAERTLSGRSGIYDVKVINQNNETVAEFRGLSRTIPGKFYPDRENYD